MPGDADGEVLLDLRHRAEELRAELATLAAAPEPQRARTGSKLTATDRSSWERAVEKSLAAIASGRH